MVNNDYSPNAAIRHPTPPNQSTYKNERWDRHRQRAHAHASCTTHDGEEASQEAGELRCSSSAYGKARSLRAKQVKTEVVEAPDHLHIFACTILVKPVSPCRLVHHDDGSLIPSMHSLLREHFTLTARFRLLLPRTCSFLALHPALWIDVQSLPQEGHFLVPIHQVRTCTSRA
jgi:hypothetical protein